MYDISDEDIDSVIDRTQLSLGSQPSPLQMQLPVLELLKVGANSYFCVHLCNSLNIKSKLCTCESCAILIFFKTL